MPRVRSNGGGRTIRSVLMPNLGIYANQPSATVDRKAVTDCLNVRISEGRLTNANVGWKRFSGAWTLNGPCTLIDNFFDSSGGQKLMFASRTDLYEWIESSDTIKYLTPRYETGTAACAGGTTAVVGTGTAWDTSTLKAGDQISFGATGRRDPTTAEQPAGPNNTWYTIASVDSATGITLTTNGPNTGGAVAYTARILMTMTSNDVWSTELFHYGLPGPADYWFGTNGSDWVLSWDGTATQCTYQSGFGFTCKALIRFKNMMIYGAITSGGFAKPANIWNSAIGEPFNVATKEADEFRAYEGISEVLAFELIGSAMAIYSARSIALATYTGPPTMFSFRTVIDGVGPLSGRGIADYGDSHEFLGPDAMYSFDGVTIKEVGWQIMREVIRKQAPGRLQQLQSHFSEETGEVYWIVPLTTDPSADSPSVAYSEHYLESVSSSTPTPFTIRELPAVCTGYFERLDTLTWDQITTDWTTLGFRWNDRFFQGAFPYNLFGDAAGNVFIIGAADDQDGAPISSYVKFGSAPAIDGVHKGVITRVQPFADRVEGASYTLGVNIYTQDQMGAGETVHGPYAYDLDQGDGRASRYVYPYTPARYFSVEFGTNGVGHTWALLGYGVEITVVGEG